MRRGHWRGVHTCRGGSQVGVGGTNRTGELRAALGLRMIRRAAWAQGRPEEQCATGAAIVVRHTHGYAKWYFPDEAGTQD